MVYECEVCFDEIDAYEEVECDFCGKIMCKSCADYNDGYCYECAQDLKRNFKNRTYSILKIQDLILKKSIIRILFLF